LEISLANAAVLEEIAHGDRAVSTSELPTILEEYVDEFKQALQE
jgi:hypothetical protein